MSPEWSTFKNARHIQVFFNARLNTKKVQSGIFDKQYLNNCYHVTHIMPEQPGTKAGMINSF